MKEAWDKLYQNQEIDYILFCLFLISNVHHIIQVKFLYFILSLQDVFRDDFDLCMS